MSYSTMSYFYNELRYHYTLISTMEDKCDEILVSLKDLIYGYEEEIDDEFNLSEIKKYNLPPDFVDAVFNLPQKEFWDCFRNNTFKEYKRLPAFKKHPQCKHVLPILLRVTDADNYQNWIYRNRYHLLYISRFQLLIDSQFTDTSVEEATHLITKYRDILIKLQEEDKKRREQEEEDEKRREEEEEEDYENSKRYIEFQNWRDDNGHL